MCSIAAPVALSLRPEADPPNHPLRGASGLRLQISFTHPSIAFRTHTIAFARPPFALRSGSLIPATWQMQRSG